MIRRCLAAACLAAAPAAAQAPGAAPDTAWVAPFRLNNFPVFQPAPNEGPYVAYQVKLNQMSDFDARVGSRQAVTARAGLTGAGSWFASARYEAPLAVRGWRFDAGLYANHERRWGEYDAGNDAPRVAGNRQVRRRLAARVEVTRQLAGPVWLALQGEALSARFRSLDSLPALPPLPTQPDASARLALLVDTRDTEYDTRRGVLLEGGVQAGTGNGGYDRGYLLARGWVPVGERTVLAARAGGSSLGGTPTRDAEYTLPAWQGPLDALGGEQTHRALDSGRFRGRGLLLASAEVRHDLVRLSDIGSITVLAFADGGRVFGPADGSVRLTLDDWKVGYGGGVALKLLRSVLFTVQGAAGVEGFNLSFGGGWAW